MAYRDLAKVWHPDRFENDPRLRKKAEEEFKLVQGAFTSLKEHRQFEGPMQKEQSLDGPLQHTTSKFDLSPDHAFQLFKSIVDGEQVHDASSVPFPTLLAVALNFKMKAPEDIRILVMDISGSSHLDSGLVFTNSAMLYRSNGLFGSNYEVAYPSLLNWEFTFTTRGMSWGEHAVAKVTGTRFQRLMLSGDCKKHCCPN